MLRSTAVRVADLYHPDEFRVKVGHIVAERNTIFAALYGDHESLDANRIADELLEMGRQLAPHVTDTTLVLHDAIASGKRILFEGAQGSLLDITHGTFPYVTSSTCTAAGVAAGAGVPPSAIKSYLGIIKAYSTRVGGGPFPTELTDAVGDRIRERGHEYGTTTGRPRRCGWFDAFATKYSIDLCGITQIVLMHLDTLSGFSELKVCTGYRHRGEKLRIFPPDVHVLGAVEPIYETLPGWDGEIGAAASFDDLPDRGRAYVELLEKYFRVPITLVSIGADRLATLHRTPIL
jgi:adenylosuccinate synthase